MTGKNDPLIDLLFTPRIAVVAEPPTTQIAFEFEFDSHYDVLGVPRNAGPEQIDAAKFAVHQHYGPRARNNADANANARLNLINKAQAVLTKPEKRKEYDQSPEAAFLSIQEPFEDQPLDWESGLALIHQLIDDTGSDLLLPQDRAIPTRPNAKLDQLLH